MLEVEERLQRNDFPIIFQLQVTNNTFYLTRQVLSTLPLNNPSTNPLYVIKYIL